MEATATSEEKIEKEHYSEGKNVTKPLDIGYTRICDCKGSNINCMTAKEWVKAQIGVWEFYYEKRDVRDKEKHPAAYPISLSSKVIKLFTHEGELVVDPFVGSGTTLVSAQDLNRNAVGFDINEDFIKLCESRLEQSRLTDHTREKTEQLAIEDDARNAYKYFKDEQISLLVTSPPYSNLLNRKRKNKSRRGKERKNDQYMKVEQYSQKENDLGILSIENFSEAMEEIYEKLLPKIKIKGHNVINVADMWWNNKRIPIHIYVIDAMENAGYELRNTIIWDRTNIVNNVGIFGWPSNYITMGTTFEYILDFWRPPDE
ncbi:MAG: DNA methyltransferase [Thermoplasmata archaeon]